MTGQGRDKARTKTKQRYSTYLLLHQVTSHQPVVYLFLFFVNLDIPKCFSPHVLQYLLVPCEYS